MRAESLGVLGMLAQLGELGPLAPLISLGTLPLPRQAGQASLSCPLSCPYLFLYKEKSAKANRYAKGARDMAMLDACPLFECESRAARALLSFARLLEPLQSPSEHAAHAIRAGGGAPIHSEHQRKTSSRHPIVSTRFYSEFGFEL